MTAAICSEADLRKDEVTGPVETVYLGGGTPSLLDRRELDLIFDKLYSNFNIQSDAEITLEANPDDLSPEQVGILRSSPVNRLSIGIQSFFDTDLKFMNRVHDSQQAVASVKRSQDAGFENITIDLIYGGQTTTDLMWEQNLDTALGLGVPHISSYALTIEPKTLLSHQIKTKKISDTDDSKQQRQFLMLTDRLTQNGFLHYEISNFGKAGFLSRHNSSYWKGIPYLGLGPSAHSYDGRNRSWNTANNTIYLNHINKGVLPIETERLTVEDRFNEMVMIRLRTADGLSLDELTAGFGTEFADRLVADLEPHLENGTVSLSDRVVRITRKGLFLSDGIASSLFRLKE